MLKQLPVESFRPGPGGCAADSHLGPTIVLRSGPENQTPSQTITMHWAPTGAASTSDGSRRRRPADNGPLTSKNEGLSHIVVEDGGSTEMVLLRDAVEELKGQLIGAPLVGCLSVLADVFQVFRQSGRTAFSHPPQRRVRSQGRCPGQTGSLLLPPTGQQSWWRLSRTLLWACSRA